MRETVCVSQRASVSVRKSSRAVCEIVESSVCGRNGSNYELLKLTA